MIAEQLLVIKPTVGLPTQQDLLDLCDCHLCPLHADFNPVFGHGAEKASLCLIGEAPGRKEAFMGRPFVGPSGQLLDTLLEDAGGTRDEVFCTNAVLCRPPLDDDNANTKPPAAAVKACARRLDAEIRAHQSAVLVPLGATAVRAVMKVEDSITSLLGQTLWSPTYDLPVLPTVHPAAALHTGSGNYVEDIGWTLKRALAFAHGTMPVPKAQPIHFEDCTTFAQGHAAIQTMLSSTVPLALDTETEGLRYLDHKLRMIQVSNGEQTWVLTDDAILGTITAHWQDLFRRNHLLWVMHNMKFDLNVLRHNFGVVPEHVQDTQCLAMGLSEQAHRTGLKILSSMYLGEPYYAGDADQWKGKDDFSSVPHAVLAEYGARDALNTFRLYPILKGATEKERTKELCTTFLMPVARTFADMEYRGVKVDLEWVDHLRATWGPQIERAAQNLQRYAESVGFVGRTASKGRGKAKVTWDEPLNPNSPLQLAELAYDYLGLETPPDKYGQRSRRRTTDQSFLAYHAGHEFVQLINEYRQRKHLMDAYVEGFAKHVWSDGRVHPDMRLWGAVTGRISITAPALQTVPKTRVDPQLAYDVRRIFVPDAGCLIGECDYRQLEVHVLHHYCADAGLGIALNEDFHRLTAAAFLDKPINEVTKHERNMSKTLVFGVIYGMDAKTLSHRLGVKVSVAAGYIKTFWSLYPDAFKWMKQIHREVYRTGELRTPWGRVRRWPLWTDKTTPGNLREAGNFPIQSFASDLNLWACTKTNVLLPERGWGYPMFPVHDSQVFMLREDTALDALKAVTEMMQECPFETCATFPVEAALGPTWADVKEIKL